MRRRVHRTVAILATVCGFTLYLTDASTAAAAARPAGILATLVNKTGTTITVTSGVGRGQQHHRWADRQQHQGHRRTVRRLHSKGPGNDTISRLAGKYTINGNAGNDTLDGGLGFDTCNRDTGDPAVNCP